MYAGLGSDVTSNLWLAGDSDELTLQLIIGSASTVTVQGSNATGLRSSIHEDDWSNLTVAFTSVDAMLNIEGGFRWMRCQRTSGCSQAVVGSRQL